MNTHEPREFLGMETLKQFISDDDCQVALCRGGPWYVVAAVRPDGRGCQSERVRDYATALQAYEDSCQKLLKGVDHAD